MISVENQEKRMLFKSSDENGLRDGCIVQDNVSNFSMLHESLICVYELCFYVLNVVKWAAFRWVEDIVLGLKLSKCK
ncbi:hypothetical protein PP935_gp196 [Rhizobium phage RHph_N34]|uniref:Uncharacterized protein n=1 Tax=Rhizobium phage RHph_N34 TaxID=2509586 RepID=A0A7S5UYW8_9CAUD|nr:hypothetical protein PP935_gp196 [Rhizobium phage RHph_N34]QIG73971.1 hypothetical protein EVC06_196 [Rhizobium phage RHph_N34]